MAQRASNGKGLPQKYYTIKQDVHAALGKKGACLQKDFLLLLECRLDVTIFF